MDKDEIQQLIEQLERGNDRQRRAASYKLGNSEDPDAVPALINAYDDTDGSVRRNVIEGLKLIRSKEAVEFLISHDIEKASPITEQADNPSAINDNYYKPLLLLSWVLYLPTLGVACLALLGLGWSGGVTEVSSSELLEIFWFLLSPIIGFFLLMKAQNNYKNNNRDGIYSPLVMVVLNSIFILFFIVSKLS